MFGSENSRGGWNKRDKSFKFQTKRKEKKKKKKIRLTGLPVLTKYAPASPATVRAPDPRRGAHRKKSWRLFFFFVLARLCLDCHATLKGWGEPRIQQWK
jgi:hypothetical protein